MMRRSFVRAAPALASLIVALAGARAAPAASAEPIPNAANSPTISVAEFDNPAGPEDIPGWFGNGVLLSGDATTALISSRSPYGDDGGTYLYERVGDEWMTSPSRVFTNPDGMKYTYTFFAAALSADGATATLAAPFWAPEALSNRSRVYLYERTDGLWSAAPVAVLRNPRPGGIDDDCFGCGPEALSADGTTLLLSDWEGPVEGAAWFPGQIFPTPPNNSNFAGRVYLYKKVNGNWNTSPVATFIEPAPTVSDAFGRSVALSADGTEVLIGTAPIQREGKVYLYQLPDDGVWPAKPQPQAVFYAPDSDVGDKFGVEVALSADGDAAFVLNQPVGGESSPIRSGIYLFEQTAGHWSEQAVGKFLIPNALPAGFYPVVAGFALSGDGKALFVGGTEPLGRSQGPRCCGVVWVYTKKNEAWDFTSPTNVLKEPGAAASSYNVSLGGGTLYGVDIAPSFDGSIALIGDPQIPLESPPPPNQVPTYGGPGVAFTFETTDDWQQSEPPPPPPPPKKPSSGGGALGWLSLLAFLALLATRGGGSRRLH